MREKIGVLMLTILIILYLMPNSYASPSIILDLINIDGRNSIRVNVYFNSSTDGYLDQVQLIMNNTIIAEWNVYSNNSPSSYIKVIGNVTGLTSFKARAHFSKYGWISSDYLYISNNMLTTTTPPSSIKDVIMLSSFILIGIALYLLFIKKWMIRL
ncbi:MAG: hypothetical protein QW128_00915 [Thermoprotei archaeon]